jgi:hypothetical protein
MSRSGYTEECEDNWQTIRWRGAVKSAIRGKRGQAFLREMLAALDAMPEKRLIAGDLVFKGEPEIQWDPYPHEDIIIGGDQLVKGNGEVLRVGDVCALGCLGTARAMDMTDIDPHDASTVAGAFGISEALAREIVYINDEDWYGEESPERRFQRVRTWVVNSINEANAAARLKSASNE